MNKRLRKQVFSLFSIFALCLMATFSHPPLVTAAAAVNGDIVYISNNNPNEVHILNPTNTPTDTTIKADTNSSYYNAQYSPDGTKIAFLWAVAPTSLNIVSYDGTPISEPGGPFIGTFSWHPNGNKLLATAQNGTSYFNIYTMNPDTTGLTQITNYAYTVFNPRFSPDGTKIVYQSNADNQVYIINADGSNPVNLTGGSHTSASFPSFSPDGSKIIYRYNSGGFKIGTMNLDGSGKAQLTSAIPSGNPVYSPDGTKIAYTDGSNNLHIMNADGSQDAIYKSNVSTISWQSRTLAPVANGAAPALSLSNSKATLNVPSLFTEPYGKGMNASSVTVTGAPKYGTTSVDSTTGVVTYTYKTTASSEGNVFSNLASMFFPKVSAATSDNFTYRVCSNSSATLCSTGTATINLLGAPVAGYPSANSPLIGALIVSSIASIGIGAYMFSKKRRHLLK